jgi:sulfate adenylyltransferase subunit 2
MRSYRRSHLRTLEDEAVHILRELAAERERPVLLFSGGKDLIVRCGSPRRRSARRGFRSR